MLENELSSVSALVNAKGSSSEQLAWGRIKMFCEEALKPSHNNAIVAALKFLRDSVPSAMESYPQALSLISQLEERLNNIVTSQ